MSNLSGVDIANQGIAGLFAARVASTPDSPAARYWRQGSWQTDTWAVMARRVARTSEWLSGHGVGSGDTLGLFLASGYAWALVDLAAHLQGSVTAVYHPAWKHAELHNAIRLHQPKLVVCGKAEHPTLDAVLLDLGLQVPVLVVHPDAPDDHFWRMVAWEGGPCRRDLPTPDMGAPATVVFTSGTGIACKGVVLSQRTIALCAWHAYRQLGYDLPMRATLHWLPFSHMFGRIGIYMDFIAGSFGTYARGAEYLPDDIREARPHVLFAVPQLLARLRKRIEGEARGRSRSASLLFGMAQRLGHGISSLPPKYRLPLQSAARKTLFRSIHAPLGRRLELLIVGSAPVDPADKAFFESIGVAVREGYGMTETGGVAAIQPWRRSYAGCGPLLPTLDACFTEQGELKLRGATLLGGYLDAEAFDGQGWFLTGDLAALAADGGLSITGRINDIVIPATGENVSPIKLEALLTHHRWVEDACVVGDKRPCLCAILSLSRQGRDSFDRDGERPVVAALNRFLEAYNQSRPRYERIRGYILLPGGFSEAKGDLTCTQKKRRSYILRRYAPEIDACYARLGVAGRGSNNIVSLIAKS